jgi:hypothetical protein
MLRNNGRKILKILFPVIKLLYSLEAGNFLRVVKTLQSVTNNCLKSEHMCFTLHDVMPSSAMTWVNPQMIAGLILN